MIAYLFSIAECQYHLVELKLKITTKTNSEITGYTSISLCDFNADSTNSKTYMLNVLNKWNTNDSIYVYKNLIQYEYFLFDTTISKEKNIVNSHINKIDLSINEIKSLTVIESKEVSIFDFISTKLELADTTWLSSNPIKCTGFGAYLCSHKIFVYEKNKNTDSVLQQLNKLQEEINPILDTMNPEKGDEYDKKMWDLINQLGNFDKIVVVSSCTD